MAFQQFQQLASSKLKFGFFMLAKLPSAFFCGVRLRSINPQQAVVSVPYKWFSQNPFHSIYFACQAMAAEMSTGVLAIGHLHRRQPDVSMLVTRISATFSKKAKERIFFTCNDGDAMLRKIEEAAATGNGTSFTATSIGQTAAGELVSSFEIEWSFKVKNK